MASNASAIASGETVGLSFPLRIALTDDPTILNGKESPTVSPDAIANAFLRSAQPLIPHF